MNRATRIAIEFFAVVLLAVSALVNLAFLGADTRAEAVQRNLAFMPANCEAGFFNHGAYLCWYTIRDHPIWFALSVAGLFASGMILAKLYDRWPKW